MCGSFADPEEPTITGRPSGHEDGCGSEAAGLWHRRDSTLLRWRGYAGPTLVALRRWRTPSDESEDRDHRDSMPDIALNWSELRGNGWERLARLVELRQSETDRGSDVRPASAPSTRRLDAARQSLSADADGLQND